MHRRRGWFPRNVSDIAALEKLNVCDPEAPPLKPTAKHEVTHGGVYGGAEEEPWLLHNLVPLATGALGGALIAIGAMRLLAPRTRRQPPGEMDLIDESTRYGLMESSRS